LIECCADDNLSDSGILRLIVRGNIGSDTSIIGGGTPARCVTLHFYLGLHLLKKMSIAQCKRIWKIRETVDHLFQCPANPEYKRIFVYTMMQQLEKIRTIPAVAQALVSGVAAWLDGSTIDHLIEDTEMIRKIRNCLITQNKIGWNVVMCGLVANEWATVQEAFKNEQDKTDSWSAKVSLWLTREARKLWLDRNEALYRLEDNTASRLEQETNENVRSLIQRTDEGCRSGQMNI
jgi:hypothetical protein